MKWSLFLLSIISLIFVKTTNTIQNKKPKVDILIIHVIAKFEENVLIIIAWVVSASGSETSVSSSTPAGAIIYDAYTSITIVLLKTSDLKFLLLKVFEWSARLTRKRAFRVQHLLAPLYLRCVYFYNCLKLWESIAYVSMKKSTLLVNSKKRSC